MAEAALDGRRTELDGWLDRLLDLDAAERARALSRLRREVPTLGHAVATLLAAGLDAPSFLDRGAADALEPGELERLEPTLASPEQPGDVLGRYRLLHRIGSGGMATVWRAVGRGPAPVALKILHPRAATPSGRRRFELEGRILSALDHPAIARVQEVGTTPHGLPFLVLELVEGTSITEHCSRERLDLEARLELMEQVCDAVAHAHRHRIVHRDLKPANVLVTQDGRVKLVDFGIAKALGSGAVPTALIRPTTVGVRPMTPEYAAPEQLGGGPIGEATDVHGLGVLLYELLTGARPIGTNPRDVAHAVRPPSSYVSLGPSLLRRRRWVRLDALVLEALATDPDRRLASAAALRDALRRLRARPAFGRRS